MAMGMNIFNDVIILSLQGLWRSQDRKLLVRLDGAGARGTDISKFTVKATILKGDYEMSSDNCLISVMPRRSITLRIDRTYSRASTKTGDWKYRELIFEGMVMASDEPIVKVQSVASAYEQGD